MVTEKNSPTSCRLERLAVENLDAKTSEIDLMRVFETYGIIEQVEISRDAQGRSRGSASVTFRRTEDARKAQATLDKQDMNGRPMHITMNTKVVSRPSQSIVASDRGQTDKSSSISPSMLSRIKRFIIVFVVTTAIALGICKRLHIPIRILLW
jgi:RNA recognition motif-containing protein